MIKKCDNFELDIELKIVKPDDVDFNHRNPNIALQYGANFELKYSQTEKRNNCIGILQFIKPSVMVGQPLGDEEKNIYIDHSHIPGDGSVPLKEYLYGTPNNRISYWNNVVECERLNDKSIIRDVPREIIPYELDTSSNTMALRSYPKMVFYDFMVEIVQEYSEIYPLGVTFEIDVVQIKNGNNYLNEYDIKCSELRRANFNDLRLGNILKINNKIACNSYTIK